ncbi:MAG TPA: efflux RND transporter periplasmic adaptor subunit [Gemmatimonadaceae bacterium]|nr:efflux RND transporter periplasmic adaptor subunit [Gemmatimonadaceae bacterium]
MRSRVSFLSLLPVLALASGCTKNQTAEAADSTTAVTARADTTASEPRSNVSLPVAAEEVRNGDLVLSVTTTGQVRSDAEATLKAELAGTVEEVLVRPGDAVRRGQPLVRLDGRPFDLAVREAEAAVDEAKLRFLEEIVPESLASGKGPSPARRANAFTKAGVQTAEVRLEKAKLDRERATVVAPFDGVVDRVAVAKGERLSGGQEVTKVVNLSDLRIEASVLEHDLPLIKVGGQALVSTAADPTRQAIGRVVAVLPLVDSTTRAGRAYVRVPGNSALRPGMYADIRLEANRLTGRRLVPARAVIERDGRPLVFVVKNGRAQWTYITPGRSNGTDTEVLPDSATGQIPVVPGDEVIVEGHLTLTHDAPVRVAKREGTGNGELGTDKRRP